MSPCLYCRRENRSFSSVEHIVPESLGNQDHDGRPALTLPRGVVCDKCNNGKLSELDQTLINFMPISLMKTMHGVKSKGNRLPKSRFGNMSLETVAPGHVVFDSNSRKSFERTPEGFKIHGIGNQRMTKPYTRKLTRAVYKMVLGCIYLDCGHDIALQERFDPVRRMILGLNNFHGYLMILKKVDDPYSQRGCRITYGFWESDGEKTVWVEFSYYGVTLFTDLEIRKPKYPESIPSELVELLYF